MSIVIAILIFGLIVLIHELGHYLFARKAGIWVEEFAIGMGPKIVGKTVGDTLYSIRAVPFGGYCKMYGEDTVEEDERSYSTKSAWQRFQVIFAGPLFNFVLAFVFAMIYIGIVGTVTTEVASVEEGSPAMESGVLVGDKVVSYNGKSILAQMELSLYLNSELPEEVILTVKRKNDKGKYVKKDLLIQPFTDEVGRYRIGVGFDVIKVRNPIDLIKYGVIEVILWIKIVFYSLGQIFSGNVSADQVAGPVGLVGAISSGYTESVKYGLTSVIATMSYYIILLSANLGVMNLLPIPALDGGRLVFIAIEAIRGKPVDPDKEGFVHFIGFVLLMGLMVLVMFNDIFGK